MRVVRADLSSPLTIRIRRDFIRFVNQFNSFIVRYIIIVRTTGYLCIISVGIQVIATDVVFFVYFIRLNE